jgi:hypothetical protein
LPTSSSFATYRVLFPGRQRFFQEGFSRFSYENRFFFGLFFLSVLVINLRSLRSRCPGAALAWCPAPTPRRGNSISHTWEISKGKDRFSCTLCNKTLEKAGKGNTAFRTRNESFGQQPARPRKGFVPVRASPGRPIVCGMRFMNTRVPRSYRRILRPWLACPGGHIPPRF